MKTFPGPEAKRILENAKKYYATTTADSRICVKSGIGALVRDVDGFEFIDFHCDASVNNLGRNNCGIMEAIQTQMATGNLFSENHNTPNDAAILLAESLSKQSPVRKPSKVFFSNSGAEANEAARKLCMGYRYHRGESKRTKAIYFRNGFAGRTGGVLSATSSKPERQRDPFWTSYDRENTIYITYPEQFHKRAATIKEFDTLDLSEVDRLMIEVPCQGEGGILPANEAQLKYIYEKARTAGVLWISDCVQCGMGRSGTLFGCDFYPWLEPDILTLGKALGGGLPIGATVFREDLDWKEGEHSNTFGGGPLVMSAAISAFSQIVNIVNSGHVQKLEKILRTKLGDTYSCYRDVVEDFRGLGAMWAIQLKTPEMRDQLIKRGEELVLRNYGRGLRLLGAGEKSVRIMPPVNIEEWLLNHGLDLFRMAVGTLRKP